MATNTPNYNLSVPENTDTMEDTVQAYRDNLVIIDNNLGGGGGGGNADVVHLTQEEYDALPASKTSDHKIYMIEDTFSEGELGRINVNGMFIDTTNVLGSGTWLSPFSYTAVQDCFVYLDGDLDNSHFVVNINGVKIYDIGSSSYVEQMLLFPLKKGQTLTATRTTNYALNYAIYGIQPASNVVIIPDYLSSCYSTSERQIGCWTDGKPLYQRTFYVTGYNIGSTPQTLIAINDIPFDYATVIKQSAYDPNDDRVYEIPNMPSYSGDRIFGHCYLNKALNPVVFYNTVYTGGSTYPQLDFSITLQYTKSTDTAGSGEWTPHGTPTVHYSTEETCIGTWIDGKPLYQRLFEFGSAVTVSNNSWTDTPISISGNDIDTIVSADGYTANKKAHWNVDTSLEVSSYVALLTGRNGDTISVKSLLMQYTKTTD